jgi:hypothetical protein
VKGLCVLRRKFVVLWVHWVVIVIVVGGRVFVEHVGQSFLGEPFLQYRAEVKVHGWGNDTRKGKIKRGKLLAGAKRPAGKACVLWWRVSGRPEKKGKKRKRGDHSSSRGGSLQVWSGAEEKWYYRTWGLATRAVSGEARMPVNAHVSSIRGGHSCDDRIGL